MKNKQGITIAALIVAIVGLSIGFAAFSNTLTISSSASVNPSDENFKVVFAKNTNVQNLDTTDVIPTKSPNNVTGFTAENAVINNEALNGPTLTNLKANFTAPGQSVTYTLNVVNAGAYVAYLKDLVFANAEHATNGETYKHCYASTKNSNNQDIAPANQATGTLVTQACNGISISVTIGTATNLTYSATPISLGNQALAANGGNVQAIITISYASNAAYVDGPMEVEFGNISFAASSNQGSNQGGNEPSPVTPIEQSNIFVGKTFSGEELESNGDIHSMEIIKNITDTTLDMVDMENGEGYITLPYTYDSTNHTLSVNNGSLEGNVIELSNNILIYFEDMGSAISSNSNVGTTMLTGYSFTNGEVYEFTESSGHGIISRSDGSDKGLYYLVDTSNGEATIYVWGGAFTVTKENGVYTSFAYQENNPYTLNPPTP